jgi:serine/threonine-protein kinase RsbW
MSIGDSSPDGGDQAPAARNGKMSNGKMQFIIRSEYAAGLDVQQQILASVEKAGFSGRELFAIKLALEEALVNAIKHGNGMDAAKQVRVEARITSTSVELLIEDEGPGFDRRHVPDPTADENLEKCSGRGILLIESYMSRVWWDRGGRRLRMIKEHLERR